MKCLWLSGIQVITFRWNEDEGKGYNVVQVFDLAYKTLFDAELFLVS